MQLDEAGTLAALKNRRSEVLQPAVSKHRGRIIKLMGDGVLIEFGSAVDAVECAVQLQQAMETANAGLPDQAKAGVDPREVRRERDQKVEQAEATTFGKVVDEFLTKHAAKLRPRTVEQ